MRSLVILVALVGLAHSARADGFYISESIGGNSYNGGLRAYGTGGLRGQIGGGYRHGDWTVEVLGGGVTTVDVLAIDCYEPEEDCNPDTSKDGYYNFFGVDLKKRWPVLQSRWKGLGLRFALHGGPRYFWGTDALHGYDGVGLSGGATIEADAWVIGYFLDLGVDVLTMRIPVDSVTGAAPHIMFGGRMGWL